MSKKTLEFHIKNDDYFGTIATVLNLVKQTADRKGSKDIDIKILDKMVKDLMLLQKNYKIIKKLEN